MTVLAYFSYGISVFSLKNSGITILEILRYTVFAILGSKTAVIDKICLRYYGSLVPRRYVLFYGLRGLCVGRVDQFDRFRCGAPGHRVDTGQRCNCITKR
jgi:hypothetical protein